MAIGDVDPEDAWDATDPVPEKLALLARILASILDELELDGETPRYRARVKDLPRLAREVA